MTREEIESLVVGDWLDETDEHGIDWPTARVTEIRLKSECPHGNAFVVFVTHDSTFGVLTGMAVEGQAVFRVTG